MGVSDDVKSLLSEQCRELAVAQAFESDLSFSYELQMQEAMSASLPQNGSSKAPVFVSDAAVPEATAIQLFSEEISNYQQRLLDHEFAEAETKKIQNDLNRRIHDHVFAKEILNVHEKEWKKTGDNIQKPFVEGSSTLARLNNEDSFRVYMKGLIMGEEAVGEEKLKISLAGIGVAVCDMNDGLVLEVSKGIDSREMNIETVEVKALIESLSIVNLLGLKTIMIFSDSYFLYDQWVIGKWRPTDTDLATLFGQVAILQTKLDSCNLSLVGEKEVKFASQFARNAIFSQARRAATSNGRINVKEICAICLENTYVDEMFSIDGCNHRYCFCCMKRHAEIKLLMGILPKCPHEKCKSELKIDDCKKFLTLELVEIMRQHIREASIPPADKIYCPYPACSALMSMTELISQSGTSSEPSARTCIKCNRHFCINCKVLWHTNMTCQSYKALCPYSSLEDAKLNSLATKSSWRQCVKCKHLVSLSEGCNHIYCRCGHEFCYVCGAEWKNKKATCRCPLWVERMIIHNINQRRG